MAELDPERRDAWLTFAVVGAGPTGVELAGQVRGALAQGAEAQLPDVRSGRGARGAAGRGVSRAEVACTTMTQGRITSIFSGRSGRQTARPA
jgi:hypothetical protein